MIEKTDLQASVSAGIITEAQAASLKALSDQRQGARNDLNPNDEPFELFRGFNEIFIVSGFPILTSGWIGVITFFVLRSTNIQNSIFISASIGGVIIWLLPEYFIKKRRMVAPAITLSIMFTANSFYGLAGGLSEIFMVFQGDNSSLVLPLLLATITMLIYWFRFKVPLVLAIVAILSFAVAILIAAHTNEAPDSIRDLFLLSANGPFALITLIIGVIVFIIAMLFDMSDPHRVTRRAANGFWLHVVAAPALVNTVALTLLKPESILSNCLLIIVMICFAVIAIVIDRRSFLIAAIGYIVVLSATVFDDGNKFFIVLFLGAFLIFLGARWEIIRARLLQFLPKFIPKNRLPPSI